MSTAETLFKAFVAVALADEIVSSEEHAVLDGLAARLRIAEPDARRWFAEVAGDRERGRAPLPQGPEDAIELLEGMVKVAAADGVILPSERQLLESVRQQLGIDAKRLDSLVAYHLSSAASTAGIVGPAADDSTTAREHFRILAVVASADGVFAPEELALLDRIRDRMGLDPAQAAELIEGVKRDRRSVKTVELPRGSSGTPELLEDIVKIVAADGVIHPAERKLLERARQALGVGERQLESLLAYELPGQEKAPPPEKRRPWFVLAVVGVVLLGVALFLYLHGRAP